ncbi:MAG: zinc-dependent dehydrogenase [Planctomycetota bacterium]|jgi:L-iditol 2-dehydrogenase
MRAAVYYSNSDVRIEERPVPEIGPGELLFRVESSGICGSDVLEWYRIKKAPIVLGHEAAGVVEKVGEGVTAFAPGDRVAVNHHVPCGECRYCLAGQHTVCDTLHTTTFDPGGFAQFVRAPEINVEKGTYLLPDSVSFDAGTFVEPLGCVLRGQREAGFRPGTTVAVLGSGISGLLHIMLARARGAGRILATDISDWRMEKAREFGADEVIDATEDVPELIRAANGNRGADLVIVCAGALSALEQGVRSVDRGGTVLFFAVPPPGQDLRVPVNDFWRNGVTLLPSYANSPDDAREAIDLISSREVDVERMITHRLPLTEAAEGFRLTAEAGESLKVVLHPNE